MRGGYDKDYVQNTAYGAGATPEAIAAADAAKADIKALKPVFVGPLKDNTGKEVIAAGDQHAPYDVWLEQTNYPGRRRRRLDHLIRCIGGRSAFASADHSRESAAKRDGDQPDRSNAPPNLPTPASSSAICCARRRRSSFRSSRSSSRRPSSPIFLLVLGKSPVAFFSLIWDRRLRNALLVDEHAGALGAADLHRALRRDPGAARHGGHRRRGGPGAWRFRLGRDCHSLHRLGAALGHHAGHDR